MFGLVFGTDQFLGITPQLNQVRQVGLQLFKKETEFYEKYGSMNACCGFFHPTSLSFTFCPVPRIPTKEVLGSHLGVMNYPLDFQVKFPPSPYRCSFLYAFDSNQNTEPTII